MYRPYVVSADIGSLLGAWASDAGFVMPPEDFFCEIREEADSFMRNIFDQYELVAETELATGLQELATASGLPVISLDRAYFQSKWTLEIARQVDRDGQDRGVVSRPGTGSLIGQIRRLRADGLKEVALLDDVIFSGELLERIISVLQAHDIRVFHVVSGIGINAGLSRVRTKVNNVSCVRVYDDVIDEVCERDFYPGVPYSGRLLSGGRNVGVPYLLPFGNPQKWASVPSESAVAFSRFFISQSLSIFLEIEQVSGRYVLCSDLSRKIVGMPNQGRFVEILSDVLDQFRCRV